MPQKEEYTKRTLTIWALPSSWAQFDELCKRTDRKPGKMFYRLLALLAGNITPDDDDPAIERLEHELHGLLSKALQPGSRRAVGESAPMPLAAGRVIDFAQAAEALRLLRERGR